LVVASVTREIVGVMPPAFSWPIDGPARADVWIPWVVRDNEKSREGGRARYIALVGRLKSGISFDQAHARIGQIRASLAAEHPAWFKDEGIRVRPLVDAIVGDRVQAWMWLLLSAVVCVLLIACVNVANLLLARTAARTQELRIRAALNASRWQLVRSVQTESLLLSVAGTALAVVAVYWTVDVIRSALPQGVPRLGSVAGSRRRPAGRRRWPRARWQPDECEWAMRLDGQQTCGNFPRSTPTTRPGQALSGWNVRLYQ
jgi:putative ABC transport system permease protein